MFMKNKIALLLVYTLKNAAPIMHKDGKGGKIKLSNQKSKK
jgi:hypothetical protein